MNFHEISSGICGNLIEFAGIWPLCSGSP